jgi:hypothetical protein
MSGEDAPRPYLENLIVLEIKTNKQTDSNGSTSRPYLENLIVLEIKTNKQTSVLRIRAS